MNGEQRLIQRFFQRESVSDSVVMGIGDDAAIVRTTQEMELVTAVDTIIEGVHFPTGLAANLIGHRALAVNLSDLAAMGACPAWALLSLSLPALDESWLQDFSEGFFHLADQFRVDLIGGDTVRGPLNVGVTVLGEVPRGRALLRSGARPGDGLYVTGTLGGAALGLRSLQGAPGLHTFEHFFLQPQPRVAAGIALRAIATAAIDISDGLAGDVGHIATASSVAIEIDIELLSKIAAAGDVDAALAGGDDYELAFTVSPQMQHLIPRNIGATRIGAVHQGQGVSAAGFDLTKLNSYDHFPNETT